MFSTSIELIDYGFLRMMSSKRKSPPTKINEKSTLDDFGKKYQQQIEEKNRKTSETFSSDVDEETGSNNLSDVIEADDCDGDEDDDDDSDDLLGDENRNQILKLTESPLR